MCENANSLSSHMRWQNKSSQCLLEMITLKVLQYNKCGNATTLLPGGFNAVLNRCQHGHSNRPAGTQPNTQQAVTHCVF